MTVRGCPMSEYAAVTEALSELVAARPDASEAEFLGLPAVLEFVADRCCAADDSRGVGDLDWRDRNALLEEIQRAHPQTRLRAAERRLVDTLVKAAGDL